MTWYNTESHCWQLFSAVSIIHWKEFWYRCGLISKIINKNEHTHRSSFDYHLTSQTHTELPMLSKTEIANSDESKWLMLRFIIWNNKMTQRKMLLCKRYHMLVIKLNHIGSKVIALSVSKWVFYRSVDW